MKVSGAVITKLIEGTMEYCKDSCATYNPNVIECQQCHYGMAIRSALIRIEHTTQKIEERSVPSPKPTPSSGKGVVRKSNTRR